MRWTRVGLVLAATGAMCSVPAATAGAHHHRSRTPRTQVLWLDSHVSHAAYARRWGHHRRRHGDEPHGFAHAWWHGWSNPNTTPPVYTAPLRHEAWYVVTVTGTFSFFTPDTWRQAAANAGTPSASVTLCGTPEAAPMFPSRAMTGPVNLDAETVVAWPHFADFVAPRHPWWRWPSSGKRESHEGHEHHHHHHHHSASSRHHHHGSGGPAKPGTTCAKLPDANGAFELTDGRGRFAHPVPLDGPHTTPTADHTYRYALRGTGDRAGFRLRDRPLWDDYGVLRITVARAMPADCASGAWQGFAEHGRPAFSSRQACEERLSSHHHHDH